MLRLAITVLLVSVVCGELEVLHAEGDHYNIGLQIGTAFKKLINHRFDTDSGLANVISFVRTKTGASAYQSYLSTVQEYYPQYVEEVRGIADGAELPFVSVMVANLIAELSALTSGPQITDCSDILIKNAAFTLIGHNEDGDNVTRATSFIVVAKITSNTTGSASYTSMHYPGQIAGDSFGFNEHGVAFSTNAMFPMHQNMAGIPRVFLGRDLLNSKNVGDMLHRINNPKQRATAFNVNVASIHDGRVFDIEIGPDDFAVREVRGTYAHFNQFLALNVAHTQEPSSDHRYNRYLKLGEPNDVKSMFEVLGDTEDKQYPIYRNGEAPDTAIVTIATALFDIRAKTMSVYNTNPKYATGPDMVLDIK